MRFIVELQCAHCARTIGGVVIAHLRALVEVDMGTLTLRRFARKIQAFEIALEDDVFRRHFKRDDFEVLVLTSSKRRLEALRHVAARVVDGGRRDQYCFATFDTLAPSAFTAASWLDLDGQSYGGVLYAI